MTAAVVMGVYVLMGPSLRCMRRTIRPPQPRSDTCIGFQHVPLLLGARLHAPPSRKPSGYRERYCSLVRPLRGRRAVVTRANSHPSEPEHPPFDVDSDPSLRDSTTHPTYNDAKRPKVRPSQMPAPDTSSRRLHQSQSYDHQVHRLENLRSGNTQASGDLHRENLTWKDFQDVARRIVTVLGIGAAAMIIPGSSHVCLCVWLADLLYWSLVFCDHY